MYFYQVVSFSLEGNIAEERCSPLFSMLAYREECALAGWRG